MKQGIEWQVSSLELSKRLKELGVPQESLWWYRFGAGTKLRCRLFPPPYDTSDMFQSYAAFTVAELGEFLIEVDKTHPRWNSRGSWWQSDGYYDFPDGRRKINADTEADARALLLIHLIEQGLVDVKLLGNKEI